MQGKKTKPQAKTEAKKVIGQHSFTELSDMSEKHDGIVDQFWIETHEWARKFAWIIISDKFRKEFWIEEFASVAVASLYVAWAKYPHLCGEEWFKFSKTVISRQIRRAFLFELSKGKVTFSLDIKLQEQAPQPSSDSLELKRIDGLQLDGGVQDIEDMHDMNVEFAEFFDSLTPSEHRILPERVDNPSATSDEIAEWAGFRTGGAVRNHELNYRAKAKSFISKHPDKSEWQRYLIDEGVTANVEIGVHE